MKLSALLLANLLYNSALVQTDCVPATDPEVVAIEKMAEEVFLAYTSHEVKSYHVSDGSLCGDSILVGIEATGKDRRIGGYWTVLYNKSNLSLKIMPGR